MNSISKKFLLISAVTAAVTFTSGQSDAANMPFFGGNGSFNVKVESYKEARFRSVVRQDYDFSCGSAAVATLLKYHYDHPVEEKEVLDAMFEDGDKEKIKSKGFSMLDMKNFLKNKGYSADGYRTALDKLTEVGIPAIVLINNNGYMHFVVVKGVDKENVLVGDPSLGKKVMARDEFEKMWNGILFVIKSHKAVGNQYFNRKKDWRLYQEALFDSALSNESLANFTIHIQPAPNYFNF